MTGPVHPLQHWGQYKVSQAAESSCEQDPGAERASSSTSDFQLLTARLVAPGDLSHDRDLRRSGSPKFGDLDRFNQTNHLCHYRGLDYWPTWPSLLQLVIRRSPGRNFDWKTLALCPELNWSIFLEIVTCQLHSNWWMILPLLSLKRG